MIKFILEVPEEYIREKTDVNYVVENFKNQSSSSPLKNFVDWMAYMSIREQIEEGKTEFLITRDSVDDKAACIFDAIMPEVAFLSKVSQKDNENEKAEKSE